MRFGGPMQWEDITGTHYTQAWNSYRINNNSPKSKSAKRNKEKIEILIHCQKHTIEESAEKYFTATRKSSVQ